MNKQEEKTATSRSGKKEELEHEDIFVNGRKEGESYKEYKVRRKEAEQILSRSKSRGVDYKPTAPTRKQRRVNGFTIEGGNTPFVRTSKVKLSKKEKKRYKKQKMIFKKNTGKLQ